MSHWPEWSSTVTSQESKHKAAGFPWKPANSHKPTVIAVPVRSLFVSRACSTSCSHAADIPCLFCPRDGGKKKRGILWREAAADTVWADVLRGRDAVLAFQSHSQKFGLPHSVGNSQPAGAGSAIFYAIMLIRQDFASFLLRWTSPGRTSPYTTHGFDHSPFIQNMQTLNFFLATSNTAIHFATYKTWSKSSFHFHHRFSCTRGRGAKAELHPRTSHQFITGPHRDKQPLIVRSRRTWRDPCRRTQGERCTWRPGSQTHDLAVRPRIVKNQSGM